MALIQRYEDLVLAVGEYLDRDDLVDLFPRFVLFAELRLDRELRISNSLAEGNFTPVSGVVTLPSDFASVAAAKMNYAPLRSMSEDEAALYDVAGYPVGYVIRDLTLTIYPQASSDVFISYYRKIPALTLASPTNWLLTSAPDLYLWATCVEAATYAKDMDRGGVANQRFSDALETFKTNDQVRRWAKAAVAPKGINP